MNQILRRISLACAIALTTILLWASFVPYAGKIFVGGSHWLSHVVSFMILGFSWRCSLTRVSALNVTLSVITFGFIHEAIEIWGHAHAYELGDAVLDGIGAIIGVLLASLVTGRRLESSGLTS